MIIFKYEFKQLFKSTMLWSIVLSLIIILMLPVYVDMLTNNEVMSIDSFEGVEYYKNFGTNLETLLTPIGAYSFLATFVLYAIAVHGMALGIKMFTKEYHNKTADFLMTKPYNRKNIFISKILAGLFSGFIISVFFTIGSLIGMFMSSYEIFPFKATALIGFSTFFIYLFFQSIGVIVAQLKPRLKTHLIVSFAFMFLSYVIASFAYKTEIFLLSIISPFTYFKGLDIIRLSGYHLLKLIGALMISFILFFIAYKIYNSKDVKLSE